MGGKLERACSWLLAVTHEGGSDQEKSKFETVVEVMSETHDELLLRKLGGRGEERRRGKERWRKLNV